MTNNDQELGFFVEDALQGASTPAGRAPRAGGTLPWVPLPPYGPACLVVSSQVQLEPVAPTSPCDANAIVLETVRYGQRRYVLMLAAATRWVRLNGSGVGPVAIVKRGDVLQAGDRFVLHASALYHPYYGPPPPALLGVECLICRLPFSPGRAVYVCPCCGAGLHCDGDDKAPEDRLQCALVGSTCPRCLEPLVRSEGYAYVPEVA